MIYQDGAEIADKIKYLNGIAVKLDEPYPTDKEWVDKVGILENKETSFSRKPYKLLGKETIGASNGILALLRDLFENDTEMVFYIEDDVIFKSGWYEKLIEIGNSRTDWGVICGCSIMGDWGLAEGVHDINGTVKGSFMRSQLYLVHRRLLPFLQGEEARRKSMPDFVVLGRSRDAKLKTLLVRPPVAQHIGLRSECHPKKAGRPWREIFDNDGVMPYTTKGEKMREVLYFWKENCKPCEDLLPNVEKVCADKGVNLTKIDFANDKDARIKFGVTATPTVIFMNDGVKYAIQVGNCAKEVISDKIEQEVSAVIPITESQIEELTATGKSIVEFTKSGFSNCDAMGDTVSEYASNNPTVKVYVVEPSNKSVSKYGLKSSPAFIGFSDGVQVNMLSGVVDDIGQALVTQVATPTDSFDLSKMSGEAIALALQKEYQTLMTTNRNILAINEELARRVK